METTKHALVASVLRREIEQGELAGELPSEAALQERFGFARGTIRTALNTLEHEGLIRSVQGARREVRNPTVWTWPMSTWEKAHNSVEDAWASSVREQGGEPSSNVAVHLERATSEIARALEVAEGERIVARRRVRSVNAEPHQLADSFFPYWLAQEHAIFLEPGDLHAPGGLLASVGLPQTRFLDALQSRMPTPEEARLLQMSAGIPLLIHHRTGYIADGRPVRYMVTRMAADRVDVRYELEP